MTTPITDGDWFALLMVVIVLWTATGFMALYWRGQWINAMRELRRLKGDPIL